EFEAAKRYLEQAIAIDPNFALAYCQLGMHYHVLSVIGLKPPIEIMPVARSAAQKALEIDPSLAEAHALLGAAAIMFDYDHIEGEWKFSLAMAQDPVPPVVIDQYGFFCCFYQGRPEEAAAHIERALQEDPLNMTFRTHLLICYAAAGKDEETLRE